MPSAADLPPYVVYSRVAEQSTRTFFTELLGTAFVYWLAGVWRMGAVLLFFLFALITAFDGLQVAGLLATNRVGHLAAIAQGIPASEAAWLRRGTYVRAGSFAVSLALLWVLAQRLW